MARTPRAKAHPAVTAATPRWVMLTSAGMAWAQAAATAGVFVLLGAMLDAVSVSGSISAAHVTWASILAVIAAALAGTGVWFSQWAGAATERRLRGEVVRGTYALGVTDPKSGERLSLATEAVERAAHYRAGFLGPIIASLTAPLLVLLIMALTVDAAIAGWLALLLLVVPVLIGGFQRTVSPIGAVYRKTQVQLTSAFLESLQAIETLVYARAARRASEDLAHVGEKYRRSLMKMLAGNQLLIFVTDAAFSLAIVVSAAALAIARIAGGTLTVGQGIAILLMTVLVTGPVDVIGRFFYIGIGGRAAVRQISEHLQSSLVERSRNHDKDGFDSSPLGFRSTNESGDVSDGGSHGGIVLDGVTAGWPGGPDVIRGFSMRVEPGERVALVGPSGVGKSTVSALLQGHIAPRDGAVHVDGLDSAAAPSGEIRSRLAVVEQRTFLFMGTIAENVRLARQDASDVELWDALDIAGLRAEVEAMPQGLDTHVGEHGTSLSGGQAQRLAIARAALRDAPILLLDEPTSQVDLAGEAAILAALDRLARGRTVLMIAHRPGAILAADRVVEMRP